MEPYNQGDIMFHAYQAVPITDDYLDVIKKKLAPEEWVEWEEAIVQGINSNVLRYLIFNFLQDPWDLSTTHVTVHTENVEKMFYITLGEDETLWLIRKK